MGESLRLPQVFALLHELVELRDLLDGRETSDMSAWAVVIPPVEDLKRTSFDS